MRLSGRFRRLRGRQARGVLDAVQAVADDPVWATAPERLVFVHYGADYREAYFRLSRGGEENYFAQRYSIETLERLAQSRALAAVCCRSHQPYAVCLPNRARAIGAGIDGPSDPQMLADILERLHPTRLILCTPIPELLRWAIERQTRTIAVLAESLPAARGTSTKIALLGDPVVEWVGCYLRHSAEKYCELGLDAEKVVAWEWPITWTPEDLPPKNRPGPAPSRLVYVGALLAGKGVGDLLAAVARLRQVRDVRLSLYGQEGDAGALRELSRSLGVEQLVHWGRVIPASAVLGAMRAADVVVVPSRPAYPEGLPLALDHSLCARTPAVVSAHPGFAQRFEHRHNAMLFSPGDADGLAACVDELLGDGELYEHVSAATADAWRALHGAIEWGELLDAWLDDTPDGRAWLRDRTLAACL